MNDDQLADALEDAMQRLPAAAGDRGSGMHTAVVGTADGDLRVMVLRDFDAATRTLRFHSDVRAPKVAVINDDPAVSILCYDRRAKVQLRCRGRARIESDGPDADAGWAGSDNYARRCYLAPHPPSTPSPTPTSNLPPDVEGAKPDDERVAQGRENFAVILVELDEIDWFHLAQEGHRRARFRWDDQGMIEGIWLTP